MANLIRGKQIATGSNGIKAVNVDTTELPTLAADNTFTGDNVVSATGSLTINGALTITGGGSAISVPEPTSGSHAATKNYVDNAIMGIDWKNSVRMASTGNLTLSGLQTIDGVVGVSGNRVLVKDQTTASQNGIYVMLSGSWTRAADADEDDEVTSGVACFVEEGSINGGDSYVITTPDPIVVGTTNLTFTLFASTESVIAGNGLTKTGNTINFVSGDDSLTVSADDVVVKRDNAGAVGLTASGLRVEVDGTTIERNSNAIRIADLGVSTAKIAANAVTMAKLERGASGSLIIGQGAGADAAYTAVSGDLSLTNAGVATIANLAVSTAKIAANAVTMAKLERGASGSIIIGQGAGSDAAYTAISGDITLTNAGVATIANDAVTTAKILNNAVTAAKINASAVGNGLTGGSGTALAVLANGDSISVGAAGVKAAVPSTSNKKIAAVVTSGNGSAATASGDALTQTPAGDGWVSVTVNGISVTVAASESDRATSACYFSRAAAPYSNGAQAVSTADLAVGDRLYWNGTFVGFELDTADTIDINYNAIV
jgi:hypothetical protein